MYVDLGILITWKEIAYRSAKAMITSPAITDSRSILTVNQAFLKNRFAYRNIYAEGLVRMFRYINALWEVMARNLNTNKRNVNNLNHIATDNRCRYNFIYVLFFIYGGLQVYCCDNHRGNNSSDFWRWRRNPDVFRRVNNHFKFAPANL